MKRILENGEEHYLAITKDAAGKPVALTWNTASHEIVEVLWDNVSGVPLKALDFERSVRKNTALPRRDYS